MDGDKIRLTLSALCLLVCCGLLAPGVALGSPGDCSVHDAGLALRRAEARYLEAKRVYCATKLYSARYGAAVGRWVRLARRTGWPWSRMAWLMYIVHRESGGQPDVVSVSGAAGLLQLMHEWADGSKDWYWSRYELPALFDRTNARETLRHGRVMDPSNWGL